MLRRGALDIFAAAWRELTTLAIVVWLTLLGLLTPLDNAFTDAEFSLFERQASGDIVIVQIDAKSLAALDTWPWPRSRHGVIIDKLSQAGAHRIAIDIDFSSKSRPEEDAALAAAIERAGGHVVLPVFSQAAEAGLSEEQILSRPLPELRLHAMTGHVNVRPDGSEVRRASLGTYFSDGSFAPSMIAMMVQNGRLELNEFAVDYSIAPNTIPRLSYVDVLEGRFDPALVKGRTVIIGATAIELGDMMPVPVHGLIPGVVFQALAAESISQDRMLAPTSPLAAVMLTLISVLILRPARAAYTWRAAGLPHLGWAFVLIAGSFLAQERGGMIVPIAAPLIATVISSLFVVFRELEQRAIALLQERAESHQKRALVNLVVKDSSDGILVIDEAGHVDIINEQAKRMLAERAPQAAGDRIAGLLPRFDELAPGEALAPELRSFELTVGAEDKRATLEIVIHPLRLQTKHKSEVAESRFEVYTIRDVSQRKRIAAAERKANEDKLAAERSRSQFVAVMSHELRTPLNSIIGFSELMSSPAGESLSVSDHVQFAREIDKSGRTLLSLVNDIIDVTRLEGGSVAIDIDEIETRPLLERTAEQVRDDSAYANQRFEVEVHDLPTLDSDARHFRRALLAVLSNACKFSPAGSLVSLAARREGSIAVIEVTDRGIGIAAEHLPRVTELFYRADNSLARQQEGRGLGLYLAKKQMDLLGGSIEITSTVGVGTLVSLRLPKAAAPAERSTRAA